MNQLRQYVKSLLLKEFLSYTDEPKPGDTVINTNPGCKHYKSQGTVVEINSLGNNMGKTIAYRCTNSGPTWKHGDVLEKTMDQVSKLQPIKESKVKITKRQLRKTIRKILTENTESVDDYKIQRQIGYLMDIEGIDYDMFFEGIEGLVKTMFGEQNRDRVYAMANAVWNKKTKHLDDIIR